MLLGSLSSLVQFIRVKASSPVTFPIEIGNSSMAVCHKLICRKFFILHNISGNLASFEHSEKERTLRDGKLNAMGIVVRLAHPMAVSS
ncbi:hypothetical protein A2U01_0061661 [Trifolium medium]|uniref:Uncharacterized protein n=1 Tax=Trifolium medium TaxID=97028 RepID=A0A392RUW9_9FABA|nr:hypothetical protein [Trifolium medium]